MAEIRESRFIAENDFAVEKRLFYFVYAKNSDFFECFMVVQRGNGGKRFGV